NDAAECFMFLPNFCDGPLDGPVLRVNFTAATDYATAIVGFFDDDGVVIEAFDSDNQSLARCFGFDRFDRTSFPSGWRSVVVVSLSQWAGWALVTVSRPTPDISFVLIGGEGNVRPIAQVQFDSPVSVQLAGLRTKSQGIGPGKALANDATLAQT